jgi:hypothetical protein
MISKMIKSILISLLVLFPLVGLAGTLVHSTPSAGTELLISGAPGSEAYICYSPATWAGPNPEATTICETVELNGAMDPVSISVAEGTPVRVQGARWVYTRDMDGNVSPLQAYEVE